VRYGADANPCAHRESMTDAATGGAPADEAAAADGGTAAPRTRTARAKAPRTTKARTTKARTPRSTAATDGTPPSGTPAGTDTARRTRRPRSAVATWTRQPTDKRCPRCAGAALDVMTPTDPSTGAPRYACPEAACGFTLPLGARRRRLPAPTAGPWCSNVATRPRPRGVARARRPAATRHRWRVAATLRALTAWRRAWRWSRVVGWRWCAGVVRAVAVFRARFAGAVLATCCRPPRVPARFLSSVALRSAGVIRSHAFFGR
jgi:hypothetical protein